MKGKHCVSIAVVALFLGRTFVSAGITDPVVTGTPAESWAYSEELNAGKGGSTTYFPASPSEFAGATFQAYITYTSPNGPNQWSGTVGDSFEVFSTFVTSATDQVVPLTFNGDDGHSLFVDGQFVAGGGFDTKEQYSLSLSAGVPRELTLAGYNGPGGAGGLWAFSIGLSQGNPNSYDPIESVPGVSISAVVPEPTSMSLLLCGMSVLHVCRRKAKTMFTFFGRHGRVDGF